MVFWVIYLTTPNRKAIIEKATELYYRDMAKSGIENFNTPEIEELREGGYLSSSQSALMRNLESKNVEWKDYNENLENFADFQFDSSEAMRTTCFISGSRGVGKSDVCMRIAQELHNEGITVIVFDPSCDWVKRSSIEQYITLKPYSDLPIPETSTIFDISRLTPNESQRCVERFCKTLFEFQIDNSMKRFYLIFEEAQIYFPLSALSSKNTQNTMRLLTVGRNFNVSMCAISQFPALISKELVKHSGQLFLGYASEPNTVRYWSGIIGKSAEKLKDLQNGEFVYYCRNKIGLTEIEPYESEVCKTQIQIPEVQPTEPIKGKEQISTMPFLRVGMVGGFVLLFLYVISKMR
jgi:hypothetical protein